MSTTSVVSIGGSGDGPGGWGSCGGAGAFIAPPQTVRAARLHVLEAEETLRAAPGYQNAVGVQILKRTWNEMRRLSPVPSGAAA